jgi:probable F420-dependent oxidoreductase
MPKIDGALIVPELARAGEAARQLEELGYDGGFTFEGPHDPFFPLVLAARETQRLELATAIAIAFARSPMLLANIGNDLHTLSHGRFILGLGSQIRPHIERRFSMPWSKPAARMRELVLAIRAIWRCWNEGEKLDFRGEFYTHTLMTPFFDPGPNRHGPPRIFVAGVGPHMTEVAGEVADGFFVHPFNTRESIRDVTLPAIARGLARGGRLREGFQISHQLMIVTGENDEELDRAYTAVRSQIAFYGSTPAYRLVLESHGWGGLQPELNALSKRGRWAEMSALVTDEIVEAIAVCAPPGELAAKLRERTHGVADRVSLIAPWAPDPRRWARLVAELRHA